MENLYNVTILPDANLPRMTAAHYWESTQCHVQPEAHEKCHHLAARPFCQNIVVVFRVLDNLFTVSSLYLKYLQLSMRNVDPMTLQCCRSHQTLTLHAWTQMIFLSCNDKVCQVES